MPLQKLCSTVFFWDECLGRWRLFLLDTIQHPRHPLSLFEQTAIVVTHLYDPEMLGPQLGFTDRQRSLIEGLRLLALLVREASQLVKHMCGFRMLGS